ncbi:outer membrane beta-barrel protein [Rhodothermus profundi]|uniref:Outer membrane protein beta-barrel domain-containing protein n=1 Tax=Rhodothermus profundi TaxID=633813 RepID=A0A1M6TQX3_9BACT|nr:outer membrane beta-barrel protein [Rhodothermus profundi]SHK59310.1 Outer membrane protein beta-barrel domain-containing protein [Rhodothermus profundi]
MTRQKVALHMLYVVLALLVLPSGAARAQLGMSVGLNFNRLSDIKVGDAQATFDNSQGWHVAIWFDLPLGPVAIRPGLRYMDAGALYQGFQDDLSDQPVPEGFDVSLLEIPIDVRYRMTLPFLTPYVMAGPVLRFPSQADREIEDNLKAFSLAGSLGVGVEVNLLGLRLYPELQYTFGITAFADEFSVGDVAFVPDARQHLNAVMLRVGIAL